jgi:hypothetical protein
VTSRIGEIGSNISFAPEYLLGKLSGFYNKRLQLCRDNIISILFFLEHVTNNIRKVLLK